MVSTLSIIVSTNLGPNLTRGKLLPLVSVPEVREVIVVQDDMAPRVPKVRCITLGPARFGRVLHVIHRVISLCIQMIRRRPSVVMGIYMMPHGLIAYVLGRITGRQVCIHVIGGPGEVIDGGYGVDEVRRPRKHLERLYLAILRRTDFVMVVGSQTKKYLASHGVSPERIHFMSSKIDARRFRPTSRAHRDYDLILAARLIRLKRVDLFLRIVADLKLRHPHIRAAILGDGPLRRDLEQLAKSLGVGDHVEFLGFHEQTQDYYSRAKVFVLTSSTEGLSLAMLEAMACGLPAVVPAVGDLADVVRDGVTGYLIEDNGQEAVVQKAFVAALDHLLEDAELRCTLGENARSTILHGYSVEDGARCWRTILGENLNPQFQIADGREPIVTSLSHDR
jgi:glycosyltransferase involved in cell wall biosynthesis